MYTVLFLYPPGRVLLRVPSCPHLRQGRLAEHEVAGCCLQLSKRFAETVRVSLPACARVCSMPVSVIPTPLDVLQSGDVLLGLLPQPGSRGTWCLPAVFVALVAFPFACSAKLGTAAVLRVFLLSLVCCPGQGAVRFCRAPPPFSLVSRHPSLHFYFSNKIQLPADSQVPERVILAQHPAWHSSRALPGSPLSSPGLGTLLVLQPVQGRAE